MKSSALTKNSTPIHQQVVTQSYYIFVSTIFASTAECYATFPLVAAIIQMQANANGSLTHAFKQQHRAGLYTGSFNYLSSRILARSSSFGTFYLFQSLCNKPNLKNTSAAAFVAACSETLFTNHSLTYARTETQFGKHVDKTAIRRAIKTTFIPHLLKNITTYSFVFPMRYVLGPMLQARFDLHQHDANALATSMAAMSIQPLTSRMDTWQTTHGLDNYKAYLSQRNFPSLIDSAKKVKNFPTAANRSVMGARIALFGLSYGIVDKCLQASQKLLASHRLS